MYQLIEPYRHYLETNCRYASETISDCLGTLPRIFQNLEIQQVQQIDPRRISRALRHSRWEITPDGIQRVEKEPAGYLLALKEFLQYLERSGFPVPEGISELVTLPRDARPKLGGLTGEEQARLREFLIFNVKNDRQRRDTALLFLLMGTDCSLAEALALKVHPDGIIYSGAVARVSGDFLVRDQQYYVRIKSARHVYREVRVPEEAIHFINFYLENRKNRSSVLFINDSGKNPLGRISEASAGRFIGKACQAAGIDLPAGQLPDILRNTAIRAVGEWQQIPAEAGNQTAA